MPVLLVLFAQSCIRNPCIARVDDLRHWSLHKLMGFASLSPSAYTAVSRIFRSLWEELCGEFGGDVTSLRDAMRDTGTVLSGSRALAFLDRQSDWMANDSDFYCSFHGYDEFCRYFIINLDAVVISRTNGPEAYADQPADGVIHPRFDTGILEVLKLRLPNGKMVDIIQSSSPSSLLPISLFHSTLVMNFCSADGFCIAYPTTLFFRMSIISPDALGPNVCPILNKYVHRGYELFASAKELWGLEADATACIPDGYCPAMLRYFGDNNCLMFPFEASRLVVPCLWRRTFPMSATVSWQFGGDRCPARRCSTPSRKRAQVMFCMVTSQRMILPRLNAQFP